MKAFKADLLNTRKKKYHHHHHHQQKQFSNLRKFWLCLSEKNWTLAFKKWWICVRLESTVWLYVRDAGFFQTERFGHHASNPTSKRSQFFNCSRFCDCKPVFQEEKAREVCVCVFAHSNFYQRMFSCSLNEKAMTYWEVHLNITGSSGNFLSFYCWKTFSLFCTMHLTVVS